MSEYAVRIFHSGSYRVDGPTGASVTGILRRRWDHTYLRSGALLEIETKVRLTSQPGTYIYNDVTNKLRRVLDFPLSLHDWSGERLNAYEVLAQLG